MMACSLTESMKHNEQDQEEAAANDFAIELLTGNANARFRVGSRWPNAAELAQAATVSRDGSSESIRVISS